MSRSVEYPAYADGDPAAYGRPSGGASDPVWRIITGTAAFGAGVFICGSVASYVPTDPSLNAATGLSAENLFGAGGAIFADLARQTLGWSSWAGGIGLMIVRACVRACLLACLVACCRSLVGGQSGPACMSKEREEARMAGRVVPPIRTLRTTHRATPPAHVHSVLRETK
ncbi:MAG: DNA translocase FtsK 4TM domain-containing protein [Pseudomonadota bacterium]